MGQKLILEVDDEADIRSTVKQVLEDEGYKVITAKDGKDCLAKIEKYNPSLILLDILMPGMTTKEILTELRKMKVKTPIIFLTVVKLAENGGKEMIKSRMKDYIQKPFENKDLIARVKKVLK